MHEDTPEFMSKHIIREAKAYLEGIQPPFFRALLDYARDGSYPGTARPLGGVAFLKSPVGQMFHQFFGENMLRADVCNAVEELGQLLDHNGPSARASATRRASSTPTTVLRHQRYLDLEQDGLAPHGCAGRCGRGGPQLPQVQPARDHHDRPIPVFLTPTRNHWASSAHPAERVQPEAIGQDPKNPLLPASTPIPVKPRILTLTQST